VPPSNKMARNRQVFPAECRERHVTYRGRLSATLEYRINGGDPVEFTREFGQVPVMIKVCIPISAFGFFYSHIPVEPMSP
jgi:DNA-directed RNA polymerase I subunit RPA2